ncbi:Fic family protein [Tautonia marina]|uniref:Fic family protein n=1 Tax=Tautonia marina TaxID=2653855 RepID=UPI001260EF62|nr:Fic/DOC family N-terminal domain-containing protein [Tautonia marina]
MPVHYHLGKFPPRNIDWHRLIPLIGPASAGLARYDGLLSAIPNAQVLLSPLTTQEAVLSSKIEGTQVTIGEVLEIEAGGESERLTQPKRDDAEEVLNYRQAMRACVTAMQHRPLSQQLMRSAHSLLMQGVRGRDKSPGSYRKEQNWIGPKGCAIEEASFVPAATEHLQSGMDSWEQYLGSVAEPDKLTQLAILHVEFEALHPFQDGNGRLGRMLIPLFLYQHKLLASPDFYMSGYLEVNREEYCERLCAVSRDDDWTGWCAFFLKGVERQAFENERKAREILKLYERLKVDVVELTHSQHSIRAVDFIFQSPIFPSTLFTAHSEIPKATAARILRLLRERGVLATLREGRGRQPGIYAFRELLNIAEGKDVL